jgi:hypothetical protein
MEAQPMVCRELVELVTEYLDDALPADPHAAVALHLDGCDGCVEYVRQLLYLADATRWFGARHQEAVERPSTAMTCLVR